MSKYFSVAHLKGMWRSFTIWFGLLTASLPELLNYVHDNWNGLLPIIPSWMKGLFGALGAVTILLRFKTTTSLANKVPSSGN